MIPYLQPCYFKKIVQTSSKEGQNFLGRFRLDPEYCRDHCTGYKNYGGCGNFITQEEVDEGGLVQLLKR